MLSPGTFAFLATIETLINNALTCGYRSSYPKISQVPSFFDIGRSEILGKLLGRRAQIMAPRHAWNLVAHEQFERAVPDAPFVLREGSPRVPEVREGDVADLAPEIAERARAYRPSAGLAHPFQAVRLALVAQLEQNGAVRLGHQGLPLALRGLRAIANLPVPVSRLALDCDGGEAHAARMDLANVLHAHAEALASAAAAESGQDVGRLVGHPLDLGEHFRGLGEAVDLLRARRPLRGHLVLAPEWVGRYLLEVYREIECATHDYQRAVRVSVRHAVEPFLHVERLHLVDGDARPLRLAMVLPGSQVEALGIARAALVPALKPWEVSRLVETADCRHGALVAFGRLDFGELVAGLAVRAVHGAAPAPAALRRVLDPAEHVLLAARGLRDGTPGAPPSFSWHNVTAFLFAEVGL